MDVTFKIEPSLVSAELVQPVHFSSACENYELLQLYRFGQFCWYVPW